MSTEATPALPHLSAEFFIWLWYASERDGGTMIPSEEYGVIDVWVEERLSFRAPDEDRPRAVVTGADTAHALEARAALAGGKVVRDLQLHLRREEREYTLILRGVHLDLVGVKLPPHAADGEDALLYERMFLYEEVWGIVGQLYRCFARERTAPMWTSETLPTMHAWVAGDMPAPKRTETPVVASAEAGTGQGEGVLSEEEDTVAV